MNDLPEALHQQAARALVASRVTHARYLQLLEAQQAALRAADLELLGRLASESLLLLQDLEAGVRLPDALIATLDRSAGPRRDDVQHLLEAVQAEVAGAHARIREFAAVLEAARTAMRHPPADSAGLSRPADSTPKGLPPPDDSDR